MAYDLGIDVGTTSTAAAVVHDDGRLEVLALGAVKDSVPTVVFLQDDATLTVGEAAARRGAIDVFAAAREFKRRLGDPTPLLLRTSPFSAELLLGRMIQAVVARATERLDGPPRITAVTQPANWGPYKHELFGQALAAGGVPDAVRLSEPQAAALAYTAQSRIPDGAIVAVYDLGGGTFDAAVLRKEAGSFIPMGTPVGIERLGGIDFDDAIFAYVRQAVGPRWPSDPDDPSLPAPMLQLRRACVEAKELLSSDTEADIAVVLPGVAVSIPLSRATFEAMIAPRIAESLDALDRSIALAGITPEQLHAVVPVGGSSRIPLVRQRLAERYRQALSADIEPVYAVARGAALAANHASRSMPAAPPQTPPGFPGPPATMISTSMGSAGVSSPVPTPSAPGPSAPAPAPAGFAGQGWAPPAPGIVPAEGLAAPASIEQPSDRTRPTSRPLWVALIVLFAVLAGAGPFKMVRGGSSDGGYGTTPLVTMAASTFSPTELVVPRGTAVVFDNNDVSPHTVTAEDASVDSGTLRPGATFSVVINERFSYFCAIHASMKATIEIEA